jgi:DNA-binding PadR family transcriptional regulator
MIREVYQAFIRLHILHHAAKELIFGVGILEELQRHGYRLSPGTLYPMLHRMEGAGFLVSEKQVVAGKVRRLYRITERGQTALAHAKDKVRELFGELFEDEFTAEPAAGSIGDDNH